MKAEEGAKHNRKKKPKNTLAIVSIVIVAIAAAACALVITGVADSAIESARVALGLTEATGKTADTDAVSDETEDETQAELEETEPEPLVQTVTITASGDCTLGRAQIHSYGGSFDEYYDKYGADYFFAGVKEIFAADDLTLVNLECVLTDSEERVEKTYNLKGRPEYTGILTASSIEAVSHGNNHCADYGEASDTDTQNALDAAGVLWAENEHTCIYTTEDGIRIGIVSASLLNEGRLAIVKSGVQSLREQGADIVIAACHWGIEREYYPTDFQRTAAHEIIDCGADLVIGNHPHVLQGIEEYNGKMICYSLGNFCFGGNRNPDDKDTMLYTQTFTYVDGVLQTDIDAAIIPCRLSGHDGYNDFQPQVAEGDAKQRIINNIREYSAPYSAVGLDDEGHVIAVETTAN